MTVKEFRERGLLWHINRTVLHPLGLALSVVVNDDGTESFGEIMTTEDPEGWIYGEGTDGQEKYERFMRTQGDAKHTQRICALGYIVQPFEKEEP